jgi:hypothetical protein
MRTWNIARIERVDGDDKLCRGRKSTISSSAIWIVGAEGPELRAYVDRIVPNQNIFGYPGPAIGIKKKQYDSAAEPNRTARLPPDDGVNAEDRTWIWRHEIFIPFLRFLTRINSLTERPDSMYQQRGTENQGRAEY